MSKLLIISKIEETVDTTVDVTRTGKIKQHTRWIAKHVELPLIKSIFGDLINHNCHMRLDLN